MEVYERLDIALDTFPMNGGSTTFIALWMGLPVVSHLGETSLNRHGLSFLSAMGLEEDVAPDAAGYVARAVALGFVLLSQGDITLAPILLVAGYCILIPLAFIL